MNSRHDVDKSLDSLDRGGGWGEVEAVLSREKKKKKHLPRSLFYIQLTSDGRSQQEDGHSCDKGAKKVGQFGPDSFKSLAMTLGPRHGHWIGHSFHFVFFFSLVFYSRLLIVKRIATTYAPCIQQ